MILATGFCVNLRFVVFSLHLRPYLMHLPRWRRMLSGYLTADLNYVLFTRALSPSPAPTTPGLRAQEAYLAGNCVVNWIGLDGAQPAGHRAGQPDSGAWGLGFAGILACSASLCSLATTPLRVCRPRWRALPRWRPMRCRSSSTSWWPLPPPWRCACARNSRKPARPGGSRADSMMRHRSAGRCSTILGLAVRHGADALLLLHLEQALDRCPTGRSAACTTRRLPRWRR